MILSRAETCLRLGWLFFFAVVLACLFVPLVLLRLVGDFAVFYLDFFVGEMKELSADS